VVFDYAQWSTRAIGYIIDSLLVFAVVAVFGLVAALAFGGLGTLAGAGGGDSDALRTVGGMGCCLFVTLITVGSLVVGLYNKVYLVAKRGYSIGQGVMKIKVVDGNGNLLTQGSAFVRLLAQIGIGFIPLGSFIDLLWPLWDVRRQTLHDKAVSCYVINAR
jgi:uncharacterized RDD family membrane protein YckC